MADQATWRKNIPEDFQGKMAETWDGEVDTGIVYKSAIAVVVAFLVACGVCWLLIIALLDFHEDPYVSPIAEANERRLPPSPLLQAKPEAEMEAMKAEMARQIDGYGFVDELENRVYIPIDRAMELVLANEGLPVAVEPRVDEPVDLTVDVDRSLAAEAVEPSLDDPLAVDPVTPEPLADDTDDADLAFDRPGDDEGNETTSEGDGRR